MAEPHFRYSKRFMRDIGRHICVAFYKNTLWSNNSLCVYIDAIKALGFIKDES
jgi:hypothetical protein